MGANKSTYDNVGGNFYDKYNSRNPLVGVLMNGFMNAFDELSAQSQAKTFYEIGCGEGELSLRLLARGLEGRGSDLEGDIVCEANQRAASMGYRSLFTTRSLYDLTSKEVDSDLIVCCEVLEHIPEPADAIDRLAKITRSYMLTSVPREPIWRLLNMARGRYLSDLGNTPGHVNHWSSVSFLKSLGRHFDVIAVRRPLPWTMALCRVRGHVE